MNAQLVGMCGNALAGNDAALICDLPAQHPGWHECNQYVGTALQVPYRAKWGHTWTDKTA